MSTALLQELCSWLSASVMLIKKINVKFAPSKNVVSLNQRLVARKTNQRLLDSAHLTKTKTRPWNILVSPKSICTENVDSRLPHSQTVALTLVNLRYRIRHTTASIIPKSPLTISTRKIAKMRWVGLHGSPFIKVHSRVRLIRNALALWLDRRF